MSFSDESDNETTILLGPSTDESVLSKFSSIFQGFCPVVKVSNHTCYKPFMACCYPFNKNTRIHHDDDDNGNGDDDNDNGNDDQSSVTHKEDLVFDSNDRGPLDKTSDGINQSLDEATRNLPDVSTWKYRPLFIQAAGDTNCPGHNPNESLPIGVPFSFESNLFKGKILLRAKNLKADDTESTKAYFKATKQCIQRQVVIQGQFKERMKMSDVWMGDLYEKKLNLSPPPRIAKFMSKIFNRLAPGIVLDLATSHPKVLALMGSACHTISVDKPGQEPDMMLPELPENTTFGNDLKSSDERKRIWGLPRTASEHEFDPDLVYTFHSMDEVLDFAEYKVLLPILKMDITKILGDGQPMSLRGVHSDNSKSFFYFRVWHERTLQRAAKRN